MNAHALKMWLESRRATLKLRIEDGQAYCVISGPNDVRSMAGSKDVDEAIRLAILTFDTQLLERRQKAAP